MIDKEVNKVMSTKPLESDHVDSVLLQNERKLELLFSKFSLQ
jgi:hypothetical protein